MGLSDFFGGNSSDNKSAGETAKGWAEVAVTTVALAAGVYGTAVEPQSTSTLTDQAGHYAAVQQEERFTAAFDRPAEAAREALDGKR